MADVLAENLSGKNVVGDDGAELGMLYNITMDLDTGTLRHLLVQPAEGVDADFERDSGGRFRVPVGRVRAVKDHIVVER